MTRRSDRAAPTWEGVVLIAGFASAGALLLKSRSARLSAARRGAKPISEPTDREVSDKDRELSTPRSVPGPVPPGLPVWATTLITSTTLIGALYLIVYQAAHYYFSHFGISPEQAGLSRDALGAGALEFGLLYAGLLAPGTILAIVLFGRIVKTGRMRPGLVVGAVALIGMSVTLGLTRGRTLPVVPLFLAVLIVYCCVFGFVGALAASVYAELRDAQWYRRWVGAVRALWVVVPIIIVLVALMFQFWNTADTSARDVLRLGYSNKAFYAMPVAELLGVSTIPVSPCLIDLGGEEAPSHLRAAVIVGQAGGRIYFVGVAGPAGFRGVPVGDAVRFSVGQSALRAEDLDRVSARWDKSHHPLPADTRACPT